MRRLPQPSETNSQTEFRRDRLDESSGEIGDAAVFVGKEVRRQIAIGTDI